MKYILLFVTLTTFILAGCAQTQKLSQIDKTLSKIKTTAGDSIIKRTMALSEAELIKAFDDWNSAYHNSVADWLYNDRPSKIQRYYAKQGINHNDHIKNILAAALYRNIHNQPLQHEELVLKYATIEKKWAEEDKIRPTADSLRGIYIPKDLPDCFKQIDSFWNDSTKTQVKQWREDEFTGRCHHGFGTWMRNNWQLWGGSRLSKYFNGMHVYHPDDMSGIILTSYHRYLSGKEIKLEEQIKYYQDYWEKMKKEK